MKELTPLERRIKAAALWAIREVRPEGKVINHRYYCFMSICDGVYDIVTYDRQSKIYTVQYDKWVGKKIKQFELSFTL